MKCTVCQNGECQPGLVSQSFDREGKVTVFRNVRAEICDNCGMRYFDSATTADLLARLKESALHHSEIEVINLRAA